jgi:PPOX class probable FMN-dependent enzyme
MSEFADHIVTSIDQLAGLYGEPYGPSVHKVADHVTPQYRAFIEAAPFFALASVSSGGVDCSPRGDAPGLVRVHDANTLLIPDRLGNNRIDTLRNLIEDPRVALLFLIPGCGETIRVMGRARISIDPKLRETFVVNGKTPRAVIIVDVEQVYFQCTKAIIRSKLWDPAQQVDRKTLPTPGMILAERTGGKMGGPEHDRAAPERIKATLY